MTDRRVPAIPDLYHLKAFLALCQTGSFTRAAERLCVTQSAVSHAFAKLERSAGRPLAVRGGRRFLLTDAGRILHAACREAFAGLERAGEEMADGDAAPTGRIRLGATVEFGTTVLIRILAPFLRENPGIAVDLICKHDPFPLLLEGDLDLAIDCRVHDRPGFARTPLFQEKYLVVASPGYLARRRMETPADLEGGLVLSLDGEGDWWANFFRALPPGPIPEFGRIMRVNHVRGMVTAAEEGIGVALVPRYCVLRELEEGRLVRLFPGIQCLEDRFFVYQARERAALARHRRLLAFLEATRPSEFGE